MHCCVGVWSCFISLSSCHLFSPNGVNVYCWALADLHDCPCRSLHYHWNTNMAAWRHLNTVMIVLAWPVWPEITWNLGSNIAIFWSLRFSSFWLYAGESWEIPYNHKHVIYFILLQNITSLMIIGISYISKARTQFVFPLHIPWQLYWTEQYQLLLYASEKSTKAGVSRQIHSPNLQACRSRYFKKSISFSAWENRNKMALSLFIGTFIICIGQSGIFCEPYVLEYDKIVRLTIVYCIVTITHQKNYIQITE